MPRKRWCAPRLVPSIFPDVVATMAPKVSLPLSIGARSLSPRDTGLKLRREGTVRLGPKEGVGGEAERAAELGLADVRRQRPAVVIRQPEARGRIGAVTPFGALPGEQ